MRRREFFGMAAVLASSAGGSSALALDGGKPVRSKPLRSTYYGPEYYDEKEQRELKDVLEARQPFRWYGPGTTPPVKVATL
ncbi:MAG TPA: hypothetical protein VGY53_04545, partial [Isosphaeraceae bacterium]|nr:hypothetical protein [Isosphaeraceae bacterium]